MQNAKIEQSILTGMEHNHRELPHALVAGSVTVDRTLNSGNRPNSTVEGSLTGEENVLGDIEGDHHVAAVVAGAEAFLRLVPGVVIQHNDLRVSLRRLARDGVGVLWGAWGG